MSKPKIQFIDRFIKFRSYDRINKIVRLFSLSRYKKKRL